MVINKDNYFNEDVTFEDLVDTVKESRTTSSK